MSQAPVTSEQLQGALQQALSHHQQGQVQQAERLYRQILNVAPRHADALHYLGVLYLQCQQPKEGAELIRQSLAIQPEQASAYLNLGNALTMQGLLEEALDSYRQALQRIPAYADAHSNMAQALLALHRPQEALNSCNAALSISQQMPQAQVLKGHALRALGRPAEALACYTQAMTQAPDYAEAHMGQGLALGALGQRQQAVASFRQVTALQTDHVEAHNNLGVMLLELSQLDEAAQAFNHVLQLQPTHAQAQANLGVVRVTQGRLAEGLACFRQALALAPGNHQAQSHLLYAMSFDPASTPACYLAEARRYGDIVRSQAQPFHDWPLATQRAEGQPLRVGLVSGDLRHHSVGHFLEQIIAGLSHEDIDLVAYATQPVEDDLTARIKPHFQLWRSVHGLDDATLATCIRNDGVQILIDVAGHTAGNRLPVFAWKPAPVQLSWLGYLASTGVPGMDYMLADAITVPPAHEEHFTETIWRLPDTANCFTPPGDAQDLPVSELPASLSGQVTFGCFQAVAKLGDEVLSAWAEILNALPGSHLHVQSKTLAQQPDREALSQRLQSAGIPLDRTTLQGPLPSRLDVLRQLTRVDIVLDTFPYPGITTTCEALWMGVPVVTQAGQTMLSRQGASLLSCAGLSDWVAESRDGYVKLALAHARDPAALAALRARLRDEVLRSPLFDAPRFASALSLALRGMWRQYCNN